MGGAIQAKAGVAALCGFGTLQVHRFVAVGNDKRVDAADVGQVGGDEQHNDAGSVPTELVLVLVILLGCLLQLTALAVSSLTLTLLVRHSLRLVHLPRQRELCPFASVVCTQQYLLEGLGRRVAHSPCSATLHLVQTLGAPGDIVDVAKAAAGRQMR